MRNIRLAGLSFLAFAATITQSMAGAALTLPPATAAKNDGGQQFATDAGRKLIGRRAPAVTLHTIDGETIDLAKLYGREPVYLKFWATWCAPCRVQMPAFEKEYETLGRKIQVVAVNTGFNDNIETVKAYRKMLGIHMPITIDDGTLAKALDLRVTPQHVVIGRDGRILYVGHQDDENLHRAFDAALKQDAGEASQRPGAAGPDRQPRTVPDALRPMTLDGTPFPLVESPTSRHATALAFFAPWCESYFQKTRPENASACRDVSAALASAHGRTTRWLAISSGLWTSAKDLQDYRKTSGISVPMTLDATGDLFRAFHITQIPTVILLDSKGRALRKLDAKSAHFAAALRAMKAAP